MSSYGQWRFNLRTSYSLIIFFFFTFLPLNLKTQEIGDVLDSSQDHFLIQSGVYGNRRSLIDTPFPGTDPAVGASPPSPDALSEKSIEPSPSPETQTPPEGDKTSSPPSSSEPAQNPPALLLSPPPSLSLPLPPPPPLLLSPSRTKKKISKVYMIVGIVVGVFTVSVALIIFFLIRNRKIPIKPWTNSGQLQDAFITDVPRMQLSEVQAACEDFSNIIGSFSDGTIYKGTLSSGAEIAVVPIAACSRTEWTTSMETHLLQKIHKLSKVDHKNFLNVIGYCREEEPFNRILVFEYAPNGSLSDHLHSQHAEHLDWPTRLRIAMGIAYCLEHMHNLNPPILHTNLDTSSVYLSEDNAAKISDFSVINSISPSEEGSPSKTLLEPSLLDLETNVFNFGAVVFEIISGKFPDSDSLFLEPKPTRDLVDPSLKTFREDVAERLLEVVRQCMNPYSAHRPTMTETVVKLREITGIEADAAMPRLSSRWWTELEIISTQGN